MGGQIADVTTLVNGRSGSTSGGQIVGDETASDKLTVRTDEAL